ncbi:peptidoglycan-binding domain-containing protein [Streptomyces sp. NPDC006173]|uniref:peptidoglycan-binding domain-containing protein n=1 Tax=Streptomyces sp. NPDC006173 TaxID=3155349 RepID=UPI0033CF4DB1
MSALWMPDAEHYDLGDHAPCDAGLPAKAIAHVTMDRSATAAKPEPHVSFGRLLTYFTGAGSSMAPHILWDPFTGQFAQFYPADSRSKSVADQAGGTRTNRAGRRVIQVEAVFFPHTIFDGKAYARLEDTPCKNWDKLHAWIRSQGVPDVWPMGRPTSFTPHRSEHTWETVSGWYAHAHVPENDHTDPGSWPQFAKVPALPSRTPRPFPTGLHPNGSNPSARGLQKALKVTGWLAESVPESDAYGPKTQAAVAGFNRKHGLNSTGLTTDPSVGPKGWKLLMSLAYGAA